METTSSGLGVLGSPKIRNIFLGVLVMRILVFWNLYGGPLFWEIQVWLRGYSYTYCTHSADSRQIAHAPVRRS